MGRVCVESCGSMDSGDVEEVDVCCTTMTMMTLQRVPGCPGAF